MAPRTRPSKRDNSDQSQDILAISPSPHQSDQEISKEPGPPGPFSDIENESPASCVYTDDEDLVTVSIPTKRSRNFYFKSVYGSSSSENSDEEIKKNRLIDQVFSQASNYTKTSRFNIFASNSSDEDIF
ncbi:hypothetical protein B5X24_HaOG213080 [Helicoverpa armigera]|nr:hypothetical protein B5X24_HaOG213080 [Helicoverpa armigera]